MQIIKTLTNYIKENVEQDYKKFIDLSLEQREKCYSWNKSKEKVYFELFFLYYFFFHIYLSLGNKKNLIEIRDLLFEKIMEEIRKISSIMNDLLTQKNVGEIKTESLVDYFEQAGYPKVNDIITQDEERENFVNLTKQEGLSRIPIFMELYDISAIVYPNRVKDLYDDVLRFLESAARKTIVVEDNPIFHSEIMEKLKSEIAKEDNSDLRLYLKLAKYSLENGNQEGMYDYLVRVTYIAEKCIVFWGYLKRIKLL
ncbi:MAG: hypothetical protein SNJ71_03545 [Bacteroidales bacterium]